MKVGRMILEIPESNTMERQKTDLEERAYKHLTLLRVSHTNLTLHSVKVSQTSFSLYSVEIKALLYTELRVSQTNSTFNLVESKAQTLPYTRSRVSQTSLTLYLRESKALLPYLILSLK